MARADRDDLKSAKYIVWCNNGSAEGWQPKGFIDHDEVIEFVESGIHTEFVITRGAISLTVEP